MTPLRGEGEGEDDVRDVGSGREADGRPGRRDVRLSVCITIELDATTLWTGTLGTRQLSDLSRGEFERVAVPRILRALKKRAITATWFVPGAVAVAFPDLVAEVVSDGHELAHHGWAHETPAAVPGDTERRQLERAANTLSAISGSRPVGYRVPGGSLPNGMVPLLREYGFEWDSSLQGSDFEAYYVRDGDTVDEDGVYRLGTETDIVEIPAMWGLDDFPAMEFVWDLNSGLRAPSAILEMWKAEFDFAHERVPNGVFCMCMHSQVVGRGHRLVVFEDLLDHIAAQAGVRFETMTAYARQWLDHGSAATSQGT